MREVTKKESLLKYRNANREIKSHRAEDVEKSITGTCLQVMHSPVHKRHEPQTGFITELGRATPGGL